MGVNDSQATKLYLRVPFKIKEELQIKELHPDIKTVILSRQKNARWCLIEFDTTEKCLAALKQLKKLKHNGKGIVAKISDRQKQRKPKKPTELSN